LRPKVYLHHFGTAATCRRQFHAARKFPVGSRGDLTSGKILPSGHHLRRIESFATRFKPSLLRSLTARRPAKRGRYVQPRLARSAFPQIRFLACFAYACVCCCPNTEKSTRTPAPIVLERLIFFR